MSAGTELESGSAVQDRKKFGEGLGHTHVLGCPASNEDGFSAVVGDHMPTAVHGVQSDGRTAVLFKARVGDRCSATFLAVRQNRVGRGGHDLVACSEVLGGFGGRRAPRLA